MIAFPAGAKVWIAGGVTDMRCGMNSLALKVQEGLGRDPHAGELFCFRGRKGDRVSLSTLSFRIRAVSGKHFQQQQGLAVACGRRSPAVLSARRHSPRRRPGPSKARSA